MPKFSPSFVESRNHPWSPQYVPQLFLTTQYSLPEPSTPQPATWMAWSSSVLPVASTKTLPLAASPLKATSSSVTAMAHEIGPRAAISAFISAVPFTVPYSSIPHLLYEGVAKQPFEGLQFLQMSAS